MPVGQPSLRQAGGARARTALLGAPVMALLFVLFPRIGPLWGVPQDGISTTGLSNTMKMGSMAEVARDDCDRACGCASRRARRRRAQLYFRGPVLTRFDGVEWRRVGAAVRAAEPAVAAAAQLRDARQAGALRDDARAAAPRVDAAARGDASTSPPIEGYASSRARRPAVARRPAGVRAAALQGGPLARSFASGRRDAPASSQESLELPPGFNPRTLALGGARSRDPAPTRRDRDAIAQRAAAAHPHGRLQLHARPGDYGARRDRRVLARPQGRLLRALRGRLRRRHARAGVPARIVTGYQGTDLPRSTATSRAPELGARMGRVLAAPAPAGRAPIRPRPSRPTASSAAAVSHHSRGSSPVR